MNSDAMSTVQALQVASIVIGLYITVMLPVSYVWFLNKFQTIKDGKSARDIIEAAIKHSVKELSDSLALGNQNLHNDIGRLDLRFTMFEKARDEQNLEIRTMLTKAVNEAADAHKLAMSAHHQLELYKKEIDPQIKAFQKIADSAERRKDAS